MYFPYLRGRQFELIALRELLEGKRISEKSYSDNRTGETIFNIIKNIRNIC